ncbi:pilus assembly protein [Kribbella qitaiheensis]|uniref:Pilus assembly protein n=1 Tax=Kribbella qitaiheensis TaxID=1544730 RepID=A0A7G6X256_9ACTN|nr:TadE family protein [Kribbella qitaiheensis]QNE20321.1 pilus assembly protein [Kribbella qitaiheensis]
MLTTLWTRLHPRRGRDRGAVTAEVAFAIPVLLATMVFGLWMAGVVIANIRCIDAARDVARAIARGELPQSAQQLATHTAPEGATVSITHDGQDIHVTVTADVTPEWPLLAKLPPIHAQAQATIQSEPATPTTP